MSRVLKSVLLMLLVASAAAAPSAACAQHEPGADAPAHEGQGDTHAKPDLPMHFQADLAIWSVVTFLVFLFVLTKIAWVPLNTAMDQREQKIRQDLAEAEAGRHKAEALLKEHEVKLAKVHDEVKEILAEARRDAEHSKQEIVATAQREAEATRQRAVADIRQAKDTALNELFDFVSQNVTQATERVLQRSLTADDQERLVREALSELNVRRN